MLKDEFSGKKMSRQRRYQLRHKREGVCTHCKEQAVMGGMCLRHAIYRREYLRKKLGCKKRLNSLSYRLEKSNGQHLPG